MADLARQLLTAEIRRLELLTEARGALMRGGMTAAFRQTRIDRSVIRSHFDDLGHLLITKGVERTLSGRATEHIERMAALPRALRTEDADLLAQVLRDHPGATDAQLRDAARLAQVSRAALNYLFGGGEPLRARLLTLPESQHSVLVEAHVPAAPAAPADSPPRAQPRPQARTDAGTDERRQARTEARARARARTQALAEARAQAQAQAPAHAPAGSRPTSNVSSPIPGRRSPTPATSPARSPAAVQGLTELAGRLLGAEIRRLELLSDARDAVMSGWSFATAHRRTGLDRAVIGNHFDELGHLLITKGVERTLSGRATEHIERMAALPRALRPEDLGLLEQVLRNNPGATDAQLRDAARGAALSRAAINYLFDTGEPLHARLLTLPQAQHGILLAAHAGTALPVSPPHAQAPMQARTEAPAATRPASPDPLHRRHLEETRRFEQVANAHLSLVQGHGVRSTAAASGLPEAVIASAFSPEGSLLLNAAGHGLAQTSDEATARRFAALPRALEAADLDRLAALMRVLPAAAEPLLRESGLAEGVSPEAVAYLFDAGVPMQHRLATLPEHQRTTLEAAMTGSRVPEPGLSPPGSPAASPAAAASPVAAGLDPAHREYLEQHLFGDSDDSPLLPPSPQELSATDIAWFRQALDMSPPPGQTGSSPSTPAQPAAAGPSGAAAQPEPLRPSTPSRADSPVAPAAAELSQELLATVGAYLRQETEHAQRYAQAQALLAGGATIHHAATSIGTWPNVLGNTFSEQGHLLLTRAAESLLQARDPSNAAPFAALPRALSRSDLGQLARVLRENPGASDEELHAVAVAARVSRAAVGYLFGTGEPLRTRLATLPPHQQRSLGIDVQDDPPGVVARRTPSPQPWQAQDMDELLAQLSFTPVQSPLAQPPAVDSPAFEGLPDPGTPPWAHLDEPMSPSEALAFDGPSWGGTPPRPAEAPARQEMAGPAVPPRDTPPPPQQQPSTPSPWGLSRPRTTPARPARAFGPVPQSPADAMSAGPSSGTKRAGEELPGPGATRVRREAPTPTREPAPQDLRWGRQAPRTRAEDRPAAANPLQDLRWGRQAPRTRPGAGRAASSDSSSD